MRVWLQDDQLPWRRIWHCVPFLILYLCLGSVIVEKTLGLPRDHTVAYIIEEPFGIFGNPYWTHCEHSWCRGVIFKMDTSLRSRRLEVVGPRKNWRARRRHAKGEEAPSPLACLPRARPFSLSPATSKRLLRRLDGHQAQNANKWKLAYARIFHMCYSRIKDVRILLYTNS